MSSNEIEGMRELSLKLDELGAKLGAQALRQAASQSLTPVVREIRAAAPVGTRAHKTYRGRIVAPGYLKRSIRRKSYVDKRRGSAVAMIGVEPEAFYGVNFLDRPARNPTRNYTPRHWFKDRFTKNKGAIENNFARLLKQKIEKIAAKKR